MVGKKGAQSEHRQQRGTGAAQSLAGILDARDTVLLVIDMQNAFCHMEGSMAKSGLDIRPMASIIPNVRAIVRAARQAALPIVWTLEESLGEKDALTRLRPRPEAVGARDVAPSSLRNTWDAEITSELAPEMLNHDHVVRKHRFSAFYSTTLDSLLRILGTQVLIVVGVNTYVCVESTIRDAYYRDIAVIEVADAVAASDAEMHAASLRVTDMFFGALATTRDIIAELEAMGADGSAPGVRAEAR